MEQKMSKTKIDLIIDDYLKGSVLKDSKRSKDLEGTNEISCN